MKKKDLYKLVKQSLKEVLQEQRRPRRTEKPLSRRDMVDALRKAGYTRDRFEDLLKKTGLTPKTLSGLSASQFNQLLADPVKFVDDIGDFNLPMVGGYDWMGHPTLDPNSEGIPPIDGCADVIEYSYPSLAGTTGFFNQSDCGSGLDGTDIGDVVIGDSNLSSVFPLSLMCCGESAEGSATVGNAPSNMGSYFTSLGLEGQPGVYCYCPFPQINANNQLTGCGVTEMGIDAIQILLTQPAFAGSTTDDGIPFPDVTFPNSTSFNGVFNFSDTPPAGCGCMDSDADNYDPNATIENNDLCTYPAATTILTACTTPGANNYYCDDPEDYGVDSPPCGQDTDGNLTILPQDQAIPPTITDTQGLELVVVVQDDPAGTVCDFPAATITACTDPGADNYYCNDNPSIPCTGPGVNVLPTEDPITGAQVIIQDTTPSMCQTTGCMIDPGNTNGNIVTVANYDPNATNPGACEIAGCLDNTQNNYICNVLPDACVGGVPNTNDHNFVDLQGACTFGAGCIDDGQQQNSPLASVDVGDVPAGSSLATYINQQPNQTGAPATNYDPDALFDDGSCEYNYDFGCIDGQTLLMPDGSVVNALNSDTDNDINWTSLTDDTNPCLFPGDGCMDDRAQNYDPSAINDDGSCLYTCYDITIQQCDIRMKNLPTKTINCAVFQGVPYPNNAIEVDDEILYEGIEIQQTQLIPPYPLEENVFNKKSILEFLNLDEVEDIEKPDDIIPQDVYSTLECCDMYNNTVVMNPDGTYTYNGFLVPNAYSTEASFGQATGYQGSSNLTQSSMGQFNNLDCSKFVDARGNQLFTNPPCSGEPVFTDISTVAPDKNHRVITVTELTDQSSITNELEVGSCPNLAGGTGLATLDKLNMVGPTVQALKESKKLRNAFKKYFLKK